MSATILSFEEPVKRLIPTAGILNNLSLTRAFGGGQLRDYVPALSLDEIRVDLSNIPHIVEHGGLFQKRVKPMFNGHVEVAHEKLDNLKARTRTRITEIGNDVRSTLAKYSSSTLG